MPTKNSSYRNLFINTIVFAIGSFSSKVLVLILLPVCTHAMAPDELGKADLIVQIANLLIPIVSLSISDAVIRFGLDRDYEKKDVFTVGITTIFCGVAVFTLLVPLFGLYTSIKAYVPLLYIYVITAIIKLTFSEFVRSRKLVALFSFNGLLTTVLMIAFNIIFLIVLKMGITGYLLAIILSDLLSSLFLFFTANFKRYISFKTFDKSIFSSMLRYSVPLIPATLLWWVTNVSDRFIVSGIMGEGANGILATAYKFPTIVTALYGMFAAAWNMSAITEVNSKERESFYSTVFESNTSLVYIAAAGVMLIVIPVMRPPIVAAEYAISSSYTPFLILSMVFTCFSSFLGGVYAATKKTKNSFYTSLAGAVINVGLNFLLIPRFGIQGAAFATFASYLVVFVYRIIDARRFVHFDFSVGKVVLNTLILTAMGLSMIFSSGTLLAFILVDGFILVCLLNMNAVFKILVTILPERLCRRLHLHA